MFKKKRSLDNIYNLIINLVNVERKRANANEQLRRDIEKEYIELDRSLEFKNRLLNEKDNEISRLEKIIENQEKENHKLHEYLEKIAEILKNNQSKILKRKKPTRADLIAEGMLKMEDSTKAKLK
jgi:N-glycosylase/DNA lyase